MKYFCFCAHCRPLNLTELHISKPRQDTRQNSTSIIINTNTKSTTGSENGLAYGRGVPVARKRQVHVVVHVRLAAHRELAVAAGEVAHFAPERIGLGQIIAYLMIGQGRRGPNQIQKILLREGITGTC